MNQFHLRYFIPGYLLLMSIGGMSLWQFLRLSVRDRAARGTLFTGLATLLLLITYGRLQARAIPDLDIISEGKSELAREVAARYVTRSLDGIAGDYWGVWPAVFMAEQYHYDNRYRGLDVLGIAYRGDARRHEFAARLAGQGSLRVGCIDLPPSACTESASAVMGLPDLRYEELAPPERVSGNHVLTLVTILPPRAGLTRPP
jgi:hypothetical protein